MAHELLGDGAGSHGTAVLVLVVVEHGRANGRWVEAGIGPKGVVLNGYRRQFDVFGNIGEGKVFALFGGGHLEEQHPVAVVEAGGATCPLPFVGDHGVDGTRQFVAHVPVQAHTAHDGRDNAEDEEVEKPAEDAPTTRQLFGCWLFFTAGAVVGGLVLITHRSLIAKFLRASTDHKN